MRSSRTTSVGCAQDGMQAAPQIGTVGADRIADDLLLELARQVELDPARQRIAARERRRRSRRAAGAMVQPCTRSDTSTTTKRDVEIELGVRHADQQRDRREEDADRAAQADPGDEHLLAPGEAERRKAQEHRRPAARSASASPRPPAPAGASAAAARGQTSSPSSTNITICASQVTASRKTTTVLCARVAPVADHEAGEIDGEEARAVHRRRPARRSPARRWRRTARAGPAAG